MPPFHLSNMNPILVLAVGVAMVIAAKYFLERELDAEQLFLLFSGVAVLFGILAMRAVTTGSGDLKSYIALGVLSMLVAVLYIEEE